MHILNAIPVLAALMATPFATALPQSSAATTIPEGYKWTITSWNAGCGRNDCTYNFNVTGPNQGIYPGFVMYCNGNDVGYFENCERVGGQSTNGVPTVKAKLAPRSAEHETVAKLGVSLMWTNAAATYNVTGSYDADYNAFAGPTETFDIVPDSLETSH